MISPPGKPFDCVVAADSADGIGKANDLPWPKLKEDLRFLRRITTDAPPGKRNAVIMGRLTWESVPGKMQPLPGRLNIVVSRSKLTLPDGATGAASLDAALALADRLDDVAGVFVIGGAQIFRIAFAHERCRYIYLTRISGTFDCDTDLPPIRPRFSFDDTLSRHREHDLEYAIERWERAEAR